MTGSLQALLAEVIDYAGIFPPARLPLEQAVRNFARYRTEPEAGLLGRFVCPAARLDELRPLSELFFDAETPWKFAILGRGGETTAGFLDGLQTDFTVIAGFQAAYGERIIADMLEVRLPADVIRPADRGQLLELFGKAQDLVKATGAPTATVFYEAPLDDHWQTTIPTVVGALGHFAHEWIEEFVYPVGFKVRAGGLEPSAFPTSEQLALAIHSCGEQKVLWKATAGLHHPIRRFDATVQTTMHGFVNLLMANALAQTHRLEPAVVRQILEDESADSFAFTETECRWRSYAATNRQVAQAHRESLVSFGSCSFDEPCEDLRAWGLL